MEIKNHRPISLISSVTKAYENLLYHRFLHCLTTSRDHILSDFVSNNFAYQRGKSTADAYRQIVDIASQHLSDADLDPFLMSVSVDLQSAFDTVEFDGLYLTLKLMKFPESLINALRVDPGVDHGVDHGDDHGVDHGVDHGLDHSVNYQTEHNPIINKLIPSLQCIVKCPAMCT